MTYMPFVKTRDDAARLPFKTTLKARFVPRSQDIQGQDQTARINSRVFNVGIE